MTDINEVNISGTILRDPVLRRTKADHDMCSMQVCVNRPEPSKAHDYLDVVMWEELASKTADSFRAGDRIRIKGRLRKANFKGLDGQKHIITQIIAEEAMRCEDEEVPYRSETAGAYMETMA